MLVVIGADVDPRLPGMRRLPDWDPWDTLDRIPALVAALGADLPPITWLLRADDTIRHVTGAFDSCYRRQQTLWTRLRDGGHELGWHFHHWTFGVDGGGFDPSVPWLRRAHAALSEHFPIRSTRTGWDYCNTETLRQLAALEVTVDFSSLPGQIVWWSIDGERIVVDWKRAPRRPYRPGPMDYQQPDAGGGELGLWEIPIASFPATPMTAIKRGVWRMLHGERSLSGIFDKTLQLTQPWPSAPRPADVLAFHFHPEELTTEGIATFAANLAVMRRAFDPEFVTASEAAARLDRRGTLKPA